MIYTHKEVMSELRREVQLRKKVYPQLRANKPTESGKLTKQEERMQLALDIFEAMTEKEFYAFVLRIQRKAQEERAQEELF
ncbi:MAG: hypothetical protein KDD02_14505 [Phaeodactylibacter sp.]|nr:hypothetical protein [Phaeodactylibacter sp.]MCB9302667.1 hypothetical protein [Lewinellaceae bacterium]